MRTRAQRILEHLASLDEWAASTRLSDRNDFVHTVVHHNPTPSRIAALVNNAHAYENDLRRKGRTEKTIRILHNPDDGSVHMWDGSGLTHDDVKRELGMPNGIHSYMILDDDGTRHVQQPMKKKFPKLYDDIAAGLSKKYPKEQAHSFADMPDRTGWNFPPPTS